MFHTFSNPFIDAPGMEDAWRQRLVMEGRGKAENIRVENEFCTFSRPEGVSVHAHDSRQGAAVRIERGRRVVGLHLENQIIFIIEFNDSCIIDKDRKAPVLRPQLFPDGICRSLDATLEQGIDDPGVALFVLVCNKTAEYLVLAVLRPSLGQTFQFDIGNSFAHSYLAAPAPYISILKITPDQPHFLYRQCQNPTAAYFLQANIIIGQINIFGPGRTSYDDLGHIRINNLTRLPGPAVENFKSLNEIIG
ncbi:MAG: hypothetical protein A4E66_02463 [Syntrophus sp. PtaB.Bin001]|nr:MAG: hypothetical protein A4E66_02463 [Syntrophus sp. PtaB.Bin001]